MPKYKNTSNVVQKVRQPDGTVIEFQPGEEQELATDFNPMTAPFLEGEILRGAQKAREEAAERGMTAMGTVPPNGIPAFSQPSSEDAQRIEKERQSRDAQIQTRGLPTSEREARKQSAEDQKIEADRLERTRPKKTG